MYVRKLSLLWLVLGILMILGTVVIKFTFLPSLMKLPAELNQSQRYEGTMRTLDPKAFTSGDLTNLLTPVTPIVADRSITVDTVGGDIAIVTSKAVINSPGSSPQSDVHTYAVSRADYSPIAIDEDQQRALVPADKHMTFEAHHGVAFSWPMNPPKNGTALYDPVTRTAQAATFIDESSVSGRAVYNYVIRGSGNVTSPTILTQFKDFPEQLPKDVLHGLVRAGIAPEASRAALNAALPSLPDVVTIGFGSTNTVDAAVDKRFGAPLKIVQIQEIFVTVPIDGKDVPVLPLSIVKLHTADSEVSASAETLSRNAMLLSALGIWLPLALAFGGLGLIVLVILRWRNQPKPPRARN